MGRNIPLMAIQLGYSVILGCNWGVLCEEDDNDVAGNVSTSKTKN